MASFVIDSIITTKKLDVNSIDLDTVEKDGSLYQVMKVLRTNRLRSSILSGNVADVRKFHTIERCVNLNADDKRIWLGKITSIDESFNESVSLSLNFINKQMI